MPPRPLRLPDYQDILARFHPGVTYKKLLGWAEDGTCPCHERLSERDAYCVNLNKQVNFLQRVLGLDVAAINAVLTEARIKTRGVTNAQP